MGSIVITIGNDTNLTQCSNIPIMADTLGGAMMPQKECFLILGGAGLVGKQIAHRIATDNNLSPRKIVIASLHSHELESALAYLRKAPGDKSIEWVGEHGNVFVRNEYADANPKELL